LAAGPEVLANEAIDGAGNVAQPAEIGSALVLARLRGRLKTLTAMALFV
jgi:hypothetical protein